MVKTYRNRGYNPRRRARRRNWKRYPKTIARAKKYLPSQKVYNFVRECEQTIDLYNPEPTPPHPQPFDLVATADGGVVGNLNFTIADLPNHGEFTTGLFKMYRLNAIKMTIYTSANAIPTVLPGNTGGQGVGIMGQVTYNKTGVAMSTGNTKLDWNQVQSKKRFVLYNKKSFYFKLNQLAYTQERGGTLTGYGVTRPKWHDVSETAIDHFGINLRFDSIADLPLSSVGAFPACKIVFRYYFQMKGVK